MGDHLGDRLDLSMTKAGPRWTEEELLELEQIALQFDGDLGKVSSRFPGRTPYAAGLRRALDGLTVRALT